MSVFTREIVSSTGVVLVATLTDTRAVDPRVVFTCSSAQKPLGTYFVSTLVGYREHIVGLGLTSECGTSQSIPPEGERLLIEWLLESLGKDGVDLALLHGHNMNNLDSVDDVIRKLEEYVWRHHNEKKSIA